MTTAGPLIDCQVTNFIRGANPIWSLVDLTGKQMDDTFYLWVLQNQIPYNLATVYHDASGTLPWTQPIQFLANGTLPVDIFFANKTIYRLEIRKNTPPNPPSQADALIYLIPDYNPSQAVDTPPTTLPGDATTNQIANAQFSVVNFTQQAVGGLPTQTYNNVTGSFEIAPGWFLDLNGAGSVVVGQQPANNLLANPTNAPYFLTLNINGYANSPILRQRFQQNGMEWAGKVVASSFTGASTAGNVSVTETLVDSNGAPLALLGTSTLFGTFAQNEHFATLGNTTNPNTPPAAYIEYRMILPTTGNISLSSFQLVVSDNQANVPYQQETIDRQIDHLYHYYAPGLNYKAAPNYLIGWDFPFNPSQINGDTVAVAAIGANKSEYKWDQTLVFQQINSGVAIARDATTGGIKATAQGSNGSFAFVQYLEQQQARELLSNSMSVYIAATSNNAGGYLGNVSLWATSDPQLPNAATGTNNSLVSAIAANGRPTCANGNWVEITKPNQVNSFFTVNSTFQEMGFYGWDIRTNALASTATYMAIVISFAPVAVNDYIILQNVGLFPGNIPSRPGVKEFTETLQECERYYEKSYKSSDVIVGGVGPITNFNALSATMIGGPILAGPIEHVLQAPFTIKYRTAKRIPPVQGFPNVTIYSPVTGAASRVSLSYLTAGGVTTLLGDRNINIWGTVNIGDKYATYLPTTNSNDAPATFDANSPNVFYNTYHYVIDSRLGIVL